MEVTVPPYHRLRVRVISLALVASLLIMAGKFYAAWLTQSAAILSDALESIINVVASAFGLFSLILAAKPPDASHPYGHGKIEFFSAGFEGALIFLAAVGIMLKAGPQIWAPRPLPDLGLGLVVIAAATVANLAVGLALVLVGRRTRSLVLTADGRHLLADVYTSVGVLGGLVLVWRSNWLWLDGAIAVLVALNILYTGWTLLRQSFAGLMDASDPTLLKEIAAILKNHRKDRWIDVHQLRARRAGDRVLLDFHLIIPRDSSLEECHQEVKELEAIFASHFHGLADVHIHVDPCRDPECPICGYQPCRYRQREENQRRLWEPEVITEPPAPGAEASPNDIPKPAK